MTQINYSQAFMEDREQVRSDWSEQKKSQLKVCGRENCQEE